MSTTLFIPRLAQSMTEGTISEWLAADGETVTEGQPIYRLETDKTETDIDAPTSGVLHITAEAGEELAVGAVVGQID